MNKAVVMAMSVGMTFMLIVMRMRMAFGVFVLVFKHLYYRGVRTGNFAAVLSKYN